MNQHEVRKIDQLFREVAETGMSRRQMIARAGAMGISAWALSSAFALKAEQAVAQGAENPLNVDPNAPLDVVIFKGGFGDAHALHVNKEMYGKLYPNAAITYAGTQRLQEQYQARVVDGNPPDIMDNSGAKNFNSTSLFSDGQLADLTDLMEAPAYGQDGVKFADSLVTGSQTDGVFDGKQYILKFTMGLYGIWYNRVLFEEKGWTYPKTWDEMLTLCETIKNDGSMAPWTYQGQYPSYMRDIHDGMVFKVGGWDAVLKLDNLAEDAWTQEPVKVALDALKGLYDKGYIMEGTEGLSHTESQALWAGGDAAFIPCGVWLENEVKDATPEGFEMIVSPIPSMTDNDAMPFEAIQAYSGEDFIVFSKGKNVQGGKEYIRLMFSKEAGKVFTEATHSLTVVNGAAEGLDLGPTFASIVAANDAAGDNTFVSRYPGLYADLDEFSQTLFSELLTGQRSTEDFQKDMQAKVDELRNNPDVPKFTVEPRKKPEQASPVASPAGSPVASPKA